MNTEQDRYFAQQALATLFSVTNKLQTQGDKYLQNLSVRQLMAMTAIIHLPNGNASIMNIARKLGATKQSTKQIISILEQNGYLATVPNEHDKRAVNVVITPQGKQMIGACAEPSNQFFSDIFREFTTKDLETLWTLLKKLYRFDGAEHDGFEENMNYLADTAEAKPEKSEAKLEERPEARFKPETKPGMPLEAKPEKSEAKLEERPEARFGKPEDKPGRPPETKPRKLEGKPGKKPEARFGKPEAKIEEPPEAKIEEQPEAKPGKENE